MVLSKFVKTGYIVTVLAMLVHVCIGAFQIATNLTGEMGWLALTNILYYLPAFVVLEIIRLCVRFRCIKNNYTKVSSVILVFVHIVGLSAFLILNADQIHTVGSYGCLLLFGSLFNKCAFYPICILIAYGADALVQAICRKINREFVLRLRSFMR